MKNFNWSSFTKEIAVRSTLENIYNAWTKQEEIEKWFLSKAEYFDQNKNKIAASENIKAGNTYNWNWFIQEYKESGKILDANGKDFIQFTFAGDCIVDVKLSQKDDLVFVELTHKNIPGDDDSKQNIRLGCASGWSFYLVNLKSVFEGGIDLRNRDPELVSMVNS